MSKKAAALEVYLEAGAKRAFAGALAWPGWCRSGRTPEAALQALLEAGPRYAQAIKGAGIAFAPPADVAALTVVEEIAGTSTTDFGAPDASPSSDEQPLEGADLARHQRVLTACWDALDRAADAAAGKGLRLGPRGGGRDLDGVLGHVLGAERSYIARIAARPPERPGEDPRAAMRAVRQAALEALTARASGVLPQRPRGGSIWTPRYYARRSAWHILDHAWEIEDRII